MELVLQGRLPHSTCSLCLWVTFWSFLTYVKLFHDCSIYHGDLSAVIFAVKILKGLTL